MDQNRHREYLPHIYFAPMEGITTSVYREVHRKRFSGIDRYYTPFLVANQTHHFKKRELRELIPFRDDLVPQVLTASSADFIWAAKYIASLGYAEVNINLGCPYPTVFTKGKGSGMLRDTDKLRRFFDEVFNEPDLPMISVKTRIGVADPAEAGSLTEIFSAFPFTEVIVHPRIREQYYEGTVHRDVFVQMARLMPHPVCYNGDIRKPADVAELISCTPDLGAVMIGRGMLEDPALARQIRGEAPCGSGELLRFLEDLWDAYSEVLYGERDVLFKMKELWHYLGKNHPDHRRALLDIKKAANGREYKDAVIRILS